MITTTLIALLVALAIWLWFGAPLPRLRTTTHPTTHSTLTAWLTLREQADEDTRHRLDELLPLLLRRPPAP